MNPLARPYHVATPGELVTSGTESGIVVEVQGERVKVVSSHGGDDHRWVTRYDVTPGVTEMWRAFPVPATELWLRLQLQRRDANRLLEALLRGVRLEPFQGTMRLAVPSLGSVPPTLPARLQMLATALIRAGAETTVCTATSETLLHLAAAVGDQY